MSDSSWELIPGQGIRQDEAEIYFGMDRSALRSALGPRFAPPISHMTDEDDFETTDGRTLIRLRFDGDKLQDIEFLNGKLRYRGIELRNNTTRNEVEEQLARLGLGFQDSMFLDEGMECSELGINIATREDVG